MDSLVLTTPFSVQFCFPAQDFSETVDSNSWHVGETSACISGHNQRCKVLMMVGGSLSLPFEYWNPPRADEVLIGGGGV